MFDLMLHSVHSCLDIEESEPVDSGQPSSSTPGPVSRVKNDSGEFSVIVGTSLHLTYPIV